MWATVVLRSSHSRPRRRYHLGWTPLPNASPAPLPGRCVALGADDGGRLAARGGRREGGIPTPAGTAAARVGRAHRLAALRGALDRGEPGA